MKKLIIIFFSAFIFINGSYGQEIQWDYPIKPGSEIWKSFSSNREKVEACQIPRNILELVSTQELFELVLNYPLLYDILVFDTPENGFRKFYEDFNGIREFYIREDAYKVIMQEYKLLIDNIPSFINNRILSELAKGYEIMKISVVEILLTQLVTVNKLDVNLLISMDKYLNDSYQQKKKNIDYFYGSPLEINRTAIQQIRTDENLKK